MFEIKIINTLLRLLKITIYVLLTPGFRVLQLRAAPLKPQNNKEKLRLNIPKNLIYWDGV